MALYEDENTSTGRSCPQLILILITLFLLLTALILCIIGVMSPSWQVVDIREFQAEHHVNFLKELNIKPRRELKKKLKKMCYRPYL